MWFGYHPEIIEKYPEINAAVVWVESVDNLARHQKIDEMLAEGESGVARVCPDRASISQQPAIAAWRTAYSRMGLKPNRYPCATEQLMRRIVDGNSIPRISALVDLGNAAALRGMIPVAPFDLARVDGYCEVRHAVGGERFWPINADQPDEISQGEVIFADRTLDVISRRWAWRQSDKGKITPETEQLVFVAEAMHADGAETVRDIGAFLARHLHELLSAETRFDILNPSNPRSERA